jgi:hypothetical protein
MATKIRPLTPQEVDAALASDDRATAEPHYHWDRTSDGYAESTISASAECSAEWADTGHHRRVKVEISGREDNKREVRVWFFDNGGMEAQQHATPWCDGSFALDMLHDDDVVRLHAALGRAIEMARRAGLCGA